MVEKHVRRTHIAALGHFNQRHNEPPSCLNSGDLLPGDHARRRERNFRRSGRAKPVWNLKLAPNLKHRDNVSDWEPFHSSTAVISAYVVPTAVDIAYGLHFVSDLVVDGLNPGPCSFFKGAAGPDLKDPCIFRKVDSWQDVGQGKPIREFNKNIVRCFATDTSATQGRRLGLRQSGQAW